MSAPINDKSLPNDYTGKEIFEIQPVIAGGNPMDPANKTVLTRAQHIQAVHYWNCIIQQARRERAVRRNVSTI